DAVLPHFDTQAPLMSLPGILGTTVATIPAKVPYLFADPTLIKKWSHEIELAVPTATHHSPLTIHHSLRLKVGIAWQGNPDQINDRFRSIRLIRFAPLAEVPAVMLFSLQKGPGTDQLAEASGRFPLIDLGTRFENFADTAAAMVNMDLLIT